MRCELYLCSDLADCGILNVIDFDVANEATILGAAAARQHSISAAPMQLYFIIMCSIVCSDVMLLLVVSAYEK